MKLLSLISLSCLFIGLAKAITDQAGIDAD
jgi:hypothetical protein